MQENAQRTYTRISQLKKQLKTQEKAKEDISEKLEEERDIFKDFRISKDFRGIELQEVQLQLCQSLVYPLRSCLLQ